MKAIDRLYSYLESKRIKPTIFERNIGFSSGYLSNMKKRNADIGESIILKINDYCHDLSIEWLLTGKGPMIKDVNVNVIAEIKETNTDIQIKPLADLLTHMHVEVGELTSKLSMQISKNEILMRENEILKTKLEKIKEKGPPGNPGNKSDRHFHSADPNMAAEEGVRYGK